MVYSLENIRFLRQELERLTEKSRELGENLAELKRRAGLAPEDVTHLFAATCTPEHLSPALPASSQASSASPLLPARWAA